MHGIWQDIRYVGRTLQRAPGFALAVVFILAVGIGANVAMFSVVSAALLRPLPYEDPERLVVGRKTWNGFLGPWVAGQDYYDYRNQSQSFESLSATLGFPLNHTITGHDEPDRISGVQATVDLFPALGVSPQIGRNFLPEEGEPGAPPVAIISHGYWQRRFGGTDDVVGATLTVDGEPHTIVGVMPRGFHFRLEADLWRPLRSDSEWVNERRFHNCILFGRLKPGVTLAQAQSEVDAISAQLEMQYPETNKGKALLLTDLREFLVKDFRPSLMILMGAVGLVLLIACGNAASLLLARGSRRRRELSVRAAMGASRARLVRQLLTESVVTAIAAGIIGTVLSVDIQRMVYSFLPMDSVGSLEAGVPISALCFALLLSVVTGVLFGAFPALRAARGNVVESLKAGSSMTDAGGARFQSGLVVTQVALSIILLIGSGLLIRSFARLQSVDPGFDTRNLLTAEIRLPETEYPEPERRIQFFSGLLEELRSIPGVSSVALANQLPFRDPGNDTYVYPADDAPAAPGKQSRTAFQRTVFPGYFKAMGIPLLKGRGIEETDRTGTPLVLVINEKMAETLFPGKDPIGRQVVVDVGRLVTLEIVGVVGRVRVHSLRGQPAMAMYFSYRQRPHYTMRIAIRTEGDSRRVAGALRSAVWERDRNLPVAEIATMEQVLARSMLNSKTTTISLALFAGFAVTLAAMGLYGLLAYYVSQRFREIGVRVALGASPRQIMELILRRGFVLVGTGIVVGLVGALLVTRLIQQLLFGVLPTDAATFALVTLFFAFVAFIACFLPARRALRVDPVIALQAE
jgi:putative ABC transport system permease protein